MPYTRSKYTKEKNQEWSVKAMDVLLREARDLTNEEIRQGDLALVGLTSQKMSRLLCDLVDRGLIMKSKDRKGKMHYKAIGTLIDEGYSIPDIVC